MYATATLLLWIMVFSLTIPGVISGSIFDMPDVEQIDIAERKAREHQNVEEGEQWEQRELEQRERGEGGSTSA